jgi:hypothetical protein
MRVNHLRGYLIVCATAAALLISPAVVAAGAGQAGAQDKDKAKEVSVQFVSFDHLNTDGNRSYVLNLSHGEPFQVKITNTCPETFSYEVQGILRAEQGGDNLSGKDGKALETKLLPVVHDEKYGGYLVTIKRTFETAVCKDGEKLQPRTLMISTPKMTWDLSFSGGFTLSSLNSPHYFLRPHPTETGKKQVQEDADKHDDANLGIASYVHLYHHRVPWLAGMFGLGIRDSNKTEYYLGGGLRFSDKATLNAGVVFGPVTRLKDGINLTDPVSDDNVLNDLPTRTKRGFFVGLSYSFIDVRGKLQQPFAGATGAAGETGKTATTQTPAAGAVCTATFDQEAVTLAATAGATETVNVTVKPDGCAWKVTGGTPAWATIEPLSSEGNKPIKITASEENPTANDRSTTVEIGGKALTITQRKK